MSKPIEVTNVRYTTATAEPVNGGGGLKFSTGVVVGAVLTAWLTLGGGCDDNPSAGPGDNRPAVQQTAPADK